MEYILTFKNTSFAIKAEQILIENGVNVSVMPLPIQISAGCGISLRIKEEDLEIAREIMRNNSIPRIGIFSKELVGKKTIYTEIGA